MRKNRGGLLQLYILGPRQMSAIQGVQAKSDEVYISTLRSILRRTTKKCAICVGSILFLWFQFHQIKRLVNVNLFYKVRYVGNQYHRSLIVVQRLGDYWDVTEVDMVGWFVED